MQAIRHLLAQRRLAGLICAAALLLKLLVPAGYMVGSDRGGIAIALCPGTASAAAAMAMAGPPGHGDMPGHGHGRTRDHGKAEMPCAFAGLSAAALGAIDPVRLAAPVAFVLAPGLVAAGLSPPAPAAHLRPPLRGPPARP